MTGAPPAAERPRALVERDGLTVVLPEPLSGAVGEAARRAAVRRLVPVFSGAMPYVGQDGAPHVMSVRLDPDVVAALPSVPPQIAERLEQDAVDAILSLGDTPEGRTADRMLRDHATFARLLAEIGDVRDRQAAAGHVDRRITFADLEAAVGPRDTARAKAEALLACLPARETRTGNGAPPPAGPSERIRVTALVETVASGLRAEFDRFVAEANAHLADLFVSRAAGGRERVEPRYRDAYDAAVKSLREPGARRVLFVRPRLEIDRTGHLALVVRPHVLARAVRYGGFQASMDVDIAHVELEALLRRRVTPLWLRLFDPAAIPSWHARTLAAHGIIPQAP